MKKTFLISGVVVLLITLVLLRINVLKLPANATRFFSNNITANFHSFSVFINNKFHFASNISEIIEKNKKLEKENRDLYNKINTLTEKIQENEILDRSMEFVKNYNYKFAKVLTTNRENNNTITINIGSKDGVEVGYPVVFEDGFLVGKIKKVNTNSSIVSLTIDKETEVSATISGYDHNIGIISGNHGLNFKLNYVSIKENIEIGDLVVTSGIENNIPAGLIIGKVSSIDSSPSNFFQDVVVSPIIPFEDFKIVSVIIPENDK